MILGEGGIKFLAKLFDRLPQLACHCELVSPLFCDQIVVGFRLVSLEDHLPLEQAVRGAFVRVRLPEIQQDDLIFLYENLFSFVLNFQLTVRDPDHRVEIQKFPLDRIKPVAFIAATPGDVEEVFRRKFRRRVKSRSADVQDAFFV